MSVEERLREYEQLIADWEGEASLRPRLVSALLGRGRVLAELGRTGEAVEAYDDVVQRFGTDDDPDVRLDVAAAVYSKADALEESDPDVALSLYGEVVERTKGDPDPRLRALAASAMLAEGMLFDDLGDQEAALSTYNEMLARYSEDGSVELRLPIARAYVNKGQLLGELGRTREASDALNTVVLRFGEDRELRHEVALAIYNGAVFAARANQVDRSIVLCDALQEGFGADPETRSWRVVFDGQAHKAACLHFLGRLDEALELYDDMLASAEHDSVPDRDDRIAKTLFDRANALQTHGRPKEAVSVYDELLARFRGNPDPAAHQDVNEVLYRKAEQLEKLGRPGDAVDTYRELVSRVSPGESSRTLELLSLAGERLRALKG